MTKRSQRSDKKDRTKPGAPKHTAAGTPPQFGALLDAFPDAAVAFDATGQLIGANQLFADLHRVSLTDAASLDWESYKRLLISALREDTRHDVAEALETDTAEIRLDVATPQPRLVRLRREPLGDGEGRLVGQLIILRDVTEQTSQLETTHRELRDTQAALLHSEKLASLGSLVAGVAHEINTPIGSINSNTDVALRALDKLRETLEKAPSAVREDPALKQAVEVLQDAEKVNKTACERIVKIVRSLRNFARLNESEWKQADLHEGLESTLTLVHHEIKNRIEIVRDYGDIPEIECFPDQLNQVFMNILVNASQAIEGKGKVTIRTRQDGDHVTISFTDTGKGITSENLPRVFDPGFTTKSKGTGSGLGLPICYKIVKEHGGRIDIQSEPGKGTTVTVTLHTSPPRAERDQPNGNQRSHQKGNHGAI